VEANRRVLRQGDVELDKIFAKIESNKELEVQQAAIHLETSPSGTVDTEVVVDISDDE
jgi:hypothetical protein